MSTIAQFNQLNKVSLLALVVCLYIFFLYAFKTHVFFYQFNPQFIDRYLNSQDIFGAVPDQRVFISDEDIYLATSYLFITGSDPSAFDSEVPPFGKYLLGLSILLFDNPYPAQIALGICLIILTFYLGVKVFNSSLIGFIASLLLVADPLFLDISSRVLLDLSQAVFMLAYIWAVIYNPKNFILQGVILGLFAGTKFWVTPLFFVILIAIYQIYHNKFNLKGFFSHLTVSFIVYALLYSRSYLLTGGEFNLLWHVLKTFKYRIQHNISSVPGASVFMFATGFYRSWWGNGDVLRSSVWSFLWPLGLLVSVISSLKKIQAKKIDLGLVVSAVPLLYLMFLGVQAPFSRYLLLVLPFAYLSLSQSFISYITNYAHRH